MAVSILEVIIISIDKSDDSWEIEGEIIFEGDFSTPFEVTYLEDVDELENLYIEIKPDTYDKRELKAKIISAATEFDE